MNTQFTGSKELRATFVLLLVFLWSEKTVLAREIAGETNHSPRALISEILGLCQEAEFEHVATLFDVQASELSKSSSLSSKLCTILETAAISPVALSDADDGDRADGLPAELEEIASLPVVSGKYRPLRLVYKTAQTGWLVSRSSVHTIDSWYDALRHGWVRNYLPAPLLQRGPLGLMYWQWVGLPIVIACAWLLAWIFRRLTIFVVARAAGKTKVAWDDKIVARSSGPLLAGWMLLLLYATLPILKFELATETTIQKLLRGGGIVVMFWLLLRFIEVIKQVILVSPWAQAHPGSKALLPLLGRVAKILILAIATVTLLAELGYPVASLVAGLGIGGLAVALAAQKTVENLFGTFSIGADQPFREGDFVKVSDFVGTVEIIGLRSTRIRTLDRTLVTMPNGQLADMKIESFSARDRIRLACTIGLVYETSAQQMETVLAGFERVLRQHPKIWPEAVVVRFKEFASSSLDVEIMAWFLTVDFGEFQAIRQEVLLAFMKVVESSGTSMAFPTQTIHTVQRPNQPLQNSTDVS